MAKHLKFRKLKKSDWKDVFKYGSDSEVTKFLNWGPFKDVSEAKKAIVLLKARKGHAFAVVVYGEMVGTGTLFLTNEENKILEAEVVLNKTHWGMGVGYSTMMQIVKLATAWYKDYTIVVKVDPKDETSLGLIKKSGFKKTKKGNFEMKIH